MTSKLTSKIYGAEYFQQTDDGKHIKMVWVDSCSHPELVGAGKQYHFAQYVPNSELFHVVNANTEKEIFERQLNAAKLWTTEHPDTRIKLLSCTVTSKGKITYPARAASPKEIAREDRDLCFWLQVYDVDPESIDTPINRANKLYTLEQSKRYTLSHNGFFFGRKGPIFQDILAHVAPDTVVTSENLKDGAEVIKGVTKMREFIDNPRW